MRKWDDDSEARYGAVSSFGIGGTNVHMIFEKHIKKSNPEIKKNELYIIPISAPTRKILMKYMEDLVNYLNNNVVNLTDFSYTLQVGREIFECKMIFFVYTKHELIEMMRAYIDENSLRKE